jgi:hypothetical protein
VEWLKVCALFEDRIEPHQFILDQEWHNVGELRKSSSPLVKPVTTRAREEMLSTMEE